MFASSNDLEKAVRSAVEPVLEGARIRSVSVDTDPSDNSVRVVVEVAKAKDRLSKDVLLHIVNAASEAVAAAGDERFAKVFGRFAATQEFAA
jgi:hypothetical protein